MFRGRISSVRSLVSFIITSNRLFVPRKSLHRTLHCQRDDAIFPFVTSIFLKNSRFYCLSRTGNSNVIQMRGLDFETCEKDITEFFKALDLTPSHVNLIRDITGRVSGVCEVEFMKHEDAVKAMKNRNAVIGNKFIRLSYKTADTYKETGIFQMSNTFELSDFQSSNENTTSGHIIRMANLPLRITDQAIFDFFATVQVKPKSIRPVHDENGCRTGEVDVVFSSLKEATTAMCKNNSRLGHRFVELILDSVDSSENLQPKQSSNFS